MPVGALKDTASTLVVAITSPIEKPEIAPITFDKKII